MKVKMVSTFVGVPFVRPQRYNPHGGAFPQRMQSYLAGLDCAGEFFGLVRARWSLIRTVIGSIIIFCFCKPTI